MDNLWLITLVVNTALWLGCLFYFACAYGLGHFIKNKKDPGSTSTALSFKFILSVLAFYLLANPCMHGLVSFFYSGDPALSLKAQLALFQGNREADWARIYISCGLTAEVMTQLTFLLFLRFALFLKKESLSAFGLAPPEKVKRALVEALIGFLLIYGLVSLYGFIYKTLSNEQVPLGIVQWLLSSIEGPSNYIVIFLTMGILIPMTEEVLFRGVIQPGMTRRLGPLGGIVAASLFFALFHFSAVRFIPLFIMGVILGTLRYRSKNLWTPILVHVVNNSASLMMVILKESSGA